MGCFNLRSLLLAAIVISNCITWTASRHSYTHVSGHRRRHRRNRGTGLALPSDFVIPGGEGSEAGWGQWGDESECSRPCGGGVKNQTRICSMFGPDGQPNCSGGATKYYSCNTQDCPDATSDYRAEQCASYNDKLFKGRTYNWVPYTNGPRPCELNCMPKGERFYYRQAPKVIDGTPCNDESFDVCVNGECQPVGCDMMLGSDAREDKCRVCRGNGSNCDTIAFIFDRNVTQGYTDIFLIPEGATNIVIEEIDKSNNYLALRSLEDNKYYLNGGYQISFPHTLQIAGALWHYERSVQGFAAPDKLRCLGPITEPLYLSLLTQETNVGIKYEYSVRKGLVPQTNAQYTWAIEDFTPCSVTCGTGFRTRNVTCYRREPFEEAEESLCDAALRPLANETCQLAECQPEWVPSPWSPCSKLCGEGSQSRTVQCHKIISNGFPSIVDETQCFKRLGDKPAEHKKCNTNGTCPTWFTGPWKPCDKLCGDGKQTRQVVCHRKTDGRVEVLVDDSCEDERPVAEQPCNIHPCDGIDWVVSDWTGCDSCLSTGYTREALCVTKDRQVVGKELCSYHNEPELKKPDCDKKLPPCQSQWYASQWSKCSADCGVGVKTRKVFCGQFVDEHVKVVNDSECDPETRYNDTTPCQVPDELCPAKWYTSDWSECTKECDGGEKFRKVMCLSGGNASNSCPESLVKPDDYEPCNQKACNIEELISVSSTTVMDDDELPECEEDGDEVGDEILTSTSLSDMMVSDGSSTPEGSGSSETDFYSTLSTVTGSDFGDTGSGDTDSTFSTRSTPTEFDSDSGATKGTSSTDIGESSTTGPTGITTGSNRTSITSGSTEPVTGSSLSGETTPTGSPKDTATSESTISKTTISGVTVASTSRGSGETVPTSTEPSPSDERRTYESSKTTPEKTPTTDSSKSTVADTISTTSESSPISTDTVESSSTTTSGSTTILDETRDTSLAPSTDTGSTASAIDTISTTSESSPISTDTVESSSTTTSGSTTILDETRDTSLAPSTDTGSTASAIDTISTTSESSPISTDTVESSSTTTSGSTTILDETRDTSLAPSTDTGSTASAIDTISTTSESSPISTDTVESSSTTTSGSTTILDETRDTSLAPSTDTGSTASAIDTISTTSESSPTPTDTAESSSTTTSGSTTISDKTKDTSLAPSTDTGSTASAIDTISTTSESSPTPTDTAESSSTTTSGSTTISDKTKDTSLAPSTDTGSTASAIDGSSTTHDGTTGSDGTTLWDASSIFTTNKPRCRPRKKTPKCRKSTFGCCPDNKTAAGGPFDEGCPNPSTCKDTKYGCCPDGVSPADDEHNRGCPVPKCEETLYGCCKSDNKTAAEGNDQEGCPPPCKASKYGCCADNDTQATGPRKAGCPETATTTTESTESTTDSSSTAETGSTETGSTETTTEGTTEPTTVGVCSIVNGTEVCRPCTEFDHGCCEDGKTPAHGPDQLGCCLLSPHGCCPDNYQAASGPDLAGCECKSSPFGCCPDGKSYARGTNFSGCGCEHTPYGCCLDWHTEAAGPSFEGCSCHTYQFGCCPDGETVAEGPNHQGCLCRDTPQGCCSDGVTVATGPDQEGCDCASSQFGCCPDGVTKSQSKNFTGCADAPVNRQAACALPYEAGPCTNYTVQWYYDLQYGGCSRFHYGGCEGNGNRFADKAECEDVCVHPTAKDVCNLPKVKGSCGDQVTRWYHDISYQGCIPFTYGGCLGNANNFESRELCEKQCVPELNQEDPCKQAIERGSCAGNYTRWGYASGECKEFLWGGCEGNSNRFTSEAACMLQCKPPGEKQPECKLPQDAGTCTQMIPYWSFNGSDERCVPIYYSGCGGNANRFTSQKQCEDSCPKSFEKDKCTLPAASGECRNYRQRWFYDTKNKQCRMFPYGGCGGNDNNFLSEAQCKAECARPATPLPTPATPPTPPTAAPRPGETPAACLLPTEPGSCGGSELRWTYSADFSECIPFTYSGCGDNGNNFPSKQICENICRPPKDICQLPQEVGPCRAALTRWYFDSSSQRCQPFYFGGCRGNANNFHSEAECRTECEFQRTSTTAAAPEPPTDICLQPAKVGPCRAALPRWYYDAAAGQCARFVYGGCQANGNNFPSARACEQRCAPPASAQVVRECRTSDLNQCVGVGRVWYFDPSSGCSAYDPAPGPQSCDVPGVFPSPDACERTCGATKDLDPCTMPRAAGNCTEQVQSWSYDELTDECSSFYYTGCNGNANRFESQDECEGQCKTNVQPPPPPPAPSTRATSPPQSQITMESCSLPVATGNCNQYLVKWYYDEARDSCERFVFTGCNGNDNRFESKGECEGLCKQGIEEPPTEASVVDEQCRLPTSLEPCGSSQIAFYYDRTQDQCLSAPIGGCTDSPNRYRTEEECLRNCGRFRGQDICHAPLNPGTCRNASQKYYWNLREGRCEPFTYGGCEGGPNRFSNEQECKHICGHLAIDPACGLPPAPGAACAGAAGGGAPRWHRSPLYGDCRLFIYYGCEGNRNNFASKQECERHCSPPAAGHDPDVNEVDCEPARRECEELRCEFGLTRTKDLSGECDRCTCDPNPCADMQCGPGQRCHIVPYRAAANEDVKFTSQCRSDCSAERVRCETLECEYTVQRTRGPDGCDRCECVRPEPNCQPFVDECSALKCHYGPTTRTIDGDGCERCTCIGHPCDGKNCPEGQRCVVTASRNATSGEPQYSGDCGTVNKPGSCPVEQSPSGSCHVECNDDADCRGVQKCCHSGCSQLCRAPAPEQAPTMPMAPQAPQPDPATEREVSSAEGGTATLRCLFHSNPPPQITWRKGEITISGTHGRYKLTSDGALQIVSLYRDDSGVYICVGQNELGSTEQQIELSVTGPVDMTAGIIEESPSDVTGDIGHPVQIRCLAYGYPAPDIRWFHGTDMVPYDSAEYEARGNTLLIRSLRADTMGEYTCQVYNGLGRAVSRTVAVRAERREGGWPDSPHWLQPPPPRTERPRPPSSQAIVEYPPIPREYTVNVHTNISATQTALVTGGRLEVSCEVDGHPEPKVSWTKNNQRLAESDRIYITPTRLSITQVAEEDAGEYACNADNGYTSDRSAVQITVQKLYIPEQCKDNQYFATCTLIVRSHLCRHEYYSKFCCRTCVEAGELNPLDLEFQADQSWTFKKK